MLSFILLFLSPTFILSLLFTYLCSSFLCNSVFILIWFDWKFSFFYFVIFSLSSILTIFVSFFRVYILFINFFVLFFLRIKNIFLNCLFPYIISLSFPSLIRFSFFDLFWRFVRCFLLISFLTFFVFYFYFHFNRWDSHWSEMLSDARHDWDLISEKRVHMIMLLTCSSRKHLLNLVSPLLLVKQETKPTLAYQRV